MTRTVFLHVGAPKTGTTYLQDRLGRNVRTLAEHGVHFPSRNLVTSPELSQFRAALDLLDQDWGGPPGHAKGSWDALVRKVRRLEGTVVISHEILAPAEPEHVARVVRDLGDSELHVVYSARDHGRQLPAAWQESIKNGRTWSYRRYRRRLRGRHPWWSRAFDLPTVLTTWGEAVPRENLHVVTVPHEHGDTLWLRFCEVLGIDPAWAPLEATRFNASLGVAETAMLRSLNRRFARNAERDTSHDQLIRRLLSEGVLANRKGTTLRTPPKLHAWTVAEGERWIEWLRTSGVHVVGDPAELLPAPPVPVEEYVDPDRVSSKAQLALALDALTAMTLEAGRRTDPDESLGNRVRSRLRR